MSYEIHSANWTIPYPAKCHAERLPSILVPLTCVDHEWSCFPWHLTRGLLPLLEKPAPRFDYLHVTAFFRARAAMLTLTGDILDVRDLHTALTEHRVQAAGIYRRHLVFYLQQLLKKHNLAELPDCSGDPEDGDEGTSAQRRNRVMVGRAIRLAEGHYVNTLNFLSMSPEMEEEVCGHSVGYWVRGAEMPAAVEVSVRRRRHETGYFILPSREEAKEMIRAGRRVKKVAFRTQGELFASVAGELDRRPQTADHRPGERAGVVGPWKVVGDFAVIVVPGAKREVKLTGKWKARAFLRYLVRRLAKGGQTEFYVEEMREGFNAQFTDDVVGKRWMSDRFREDLFRGKEREFDTLFEIVDRSSGRYRMRG